MLGKSNLHWQNVCSIRTSTAVSKVRVLNRFVEYDAGALVTILWLHTFYWGELMVDPIPNIMVLLISEAVREF